MLKFQSWVDRSQKSGPPFQVLFSSGLNPPELENSASFYFESSIQSPEQYKLNANPGGIKPETYIYSIYMYIYIIYIYITNVFRFCAVCPFLLADYWTHPGFPNKYIENAVDANELGKYSKLIRSQKL